MAAEPVLLIDDQAMNWESDAGQSLVELALALPLLLLILLGLVDFGRALRYTTVIANAAREGAVYAALHPSTASAASIAQKVCDETGFAPYGDPCPGLAVPDPRFGTDQDVVITVTYEFGSVTAYLVDRIVGVNPMRLRAVATFPRLAP